jgi:hypothetical protein
MARENVMIGHIRNGGERLFALRRIPYNGFRILVSVLTYVVSETKKTQ